MKILFVNEIGGLWGGVEQNILLAIRGLSERGHACHLFCERLSDRGVELFTDVCVTVSSREQGHSIKELVEKIRPQVIYAHKIESAGELLSAGETLRTVRMVHDHDLYCPRRHKYYVHNRHICRHAAGLICYADLAFLERGPSGAFRYVSIRKHRNRMKEHRSLDLLIAGSRYMVDQLILNGFSRQQIALLPPAVMFTDTRVTAVQQTKRILYVGQLIRGKGVDLLLDALQKCSPEISLDIVGTGNDEGMLKERVFDGPLKDRVVFHGWVDHEQLIEMYDQAMCSVVPSRWPEPFGMVGLEAMLRKRPVIGFAVGGIPDWLKDRVTGYLVPAADTAMMAEKITRLTSDPALCRVMGEAGWKSVHEHFDFSAYIDRLEHLLEGST